MCRRFASLFPIQAIAAHFRATDPLSDPHPSWNVAPGQLAPVVRHHHTTGERRVDLLEWVLIAYFNRDLAGRAKPINARSEFADTAPMFRSAMANRRCIVAVDAFYEWRSLEAGGQSHAIARRDGSPMAIAGDRGFMGIADGSDQRTFAILTTTAIGRWRRCMGVCPSSSKKLIGRFGSASDRRMRPR